MNLNIDLRLYNCENYVYSNIIYDINFNYVKILITIKLEFGEK